MKRPRSFSLNQTLRLSTAFAICAVASTTCAPLAQAAEPSGIKSVVAAVDARYHTHGHGVPLMWIVSGIARGYSHGGVRGVKVVTYERFAGAADRTELAKLIGARLEDGWSLMVRERATASDGEDNMVWVQPHGKRMRMLVVNVEAGDLNLVQMELSPEALAKWSEEHGS